MHELVLLVFWLWSKSDPHRIMTRVQAT